MRRGTLFILLGALGASACAAAQRKPEPSAATRQAPPTAAANEPRRQPADDAGEPPRAAATKDGQARSGLSLEDAVRDARGSVLKLGQTPWTEARQASARALLSLARLVDGACRGERRCPPDSNIRDQAERLQKSDPLTFGEAAWIKAGLVAALAALDTQNAPCARKASVLPPWTSAAGAAVAAIAGPTSLAFQRAQVQDAFRAVVDAFAVAAQMERRCP